MDGITALERSYEGLAKLVADLRQEQLTAATPCPEWDVRGLLDHTLGAGLMFARVNRGEVATEDAGDVVGADPAGAVARVARENLDAWRRPGALDGDRSYPFGTFPAPAALMINVGEVAVHGWDLARATGRPPVLDEALADALYTFYRPLPLQPYRDMGAFGPEVPVDEGAPPADRLLGLLGRRPDG